MAGKRINLADLAKEEILPAPVPRVPSASLQTVPLQDLAANPLNPRVEMGDLVELRDSLLSIGQLQTCPAVSRDVFLAIYPEHADRIGSARYVIVAGGRRHAAATLAKVPLDISVKDRLASSRAAFYEATVRENIDRKNFNIYEEALAVQQLVDECGSGTQAAERLGRTKGWVSQRLALLKLSPEMLALLTSGELPVRDARRLAALPHETQLSTWQTERDAAVAERKGFTAVNPGDREPAGDAVVDDGHSPANGATANPARTTHSDSGKATSDVSPPSPLRRLGTTPEEIAAALRQHLDPVVLRAVVQILSVA